MRLVGQYPAGRSPLSLSPSRSSSMSGFEDDFGEMVEPASVPLEGSGEVMDLRQAPGSWRRRDEIVKQIFLVFVVFVFLMCIAFSWIG